MDDGKMFFLALTMLGAMSLGVIAWKACRFLGDMLKARMGNDAPLTRAIKEIDKPDTLGM